MVITKASCIALVAFALTTITHAQQAPARAMYTAGDVVPVSIHFVEPAAVRVGLQFRRNGDYTPGYAGRQYTVDFSAWAPEKLPPEPQAKYVIPVKIPEDAAEGTYRLIAVFVKLPGNESKTFAPPDIADITIDVRAAHPAPKFPQIKSITVQKAGASSALVAP